MKYYRNFEAFITNKILKKIPLEKKNSLDCSKTPPGSERIPPPLCWWRRSENHPHSSRAPNRSAQLPGRQIYEISSSVWQPHIRNIFCVEQFVIPVCAHSFSEQWCIFQHHLNFPPDSSGASLTLTSGGELKHFFGYDADCMFGQEGHWKYDTFWKAWRDSWKMSAGI